MDVCRLSLVSKTFYSAAESNTVWERFLPSNPDFTSNISSSSSSSSKKALFFALCDRPIITHQGRKSLQLDKRSGKKCYMLSARELHIVWGGTPQYWKWTNLAESRFQEVARLIAVCWLKLGGTMSTSALSPNTRYAVYLVFKMIDAEGFHNHPVTLSLGILGGHSYSKNVCLDPNLDDYELDERFRGLERPRVRRDGWFEIEMGEFFNSGIEHDELHFSIRETTSNMWKHGFFLEGIEFRPKYVGTVN
ncbi:F-box protein At2g02240-like [Abrus precatorius]|uniref:F-box protein At2g02240-like n=1 Tax=Abrus precatorius TaxID=3816 RepID=A0A8B8MIS2_ABRPR|nr:F-box protein At2g02240-like [Abrus precatorius]